MNNGKSNYDERKHDAFGCFGIIVYVGLSTLITAYLIISEHALSQLVISWVTDDPDVYQLSHVAGLVFLIVSITLLPIIVLATILLSRSRS